MMCLQNIVFLLSIFLLAATESTGVGNTTCSSNEWQCANGSCVQLDKNCDGIINCKDGSDENLINCRKTKDRRPMFGLAVHCSSPWKDRYPGVCPDICSYQSQYCYYAVFAENGAPNTCRFPPFPENGNYTVVVDEVWNPTSTFTTINFSIHYNCTLGTVVRGAEDVRCENGTWAPESFPYCSDACKVEKLPGYHYNCTTDSKVISPCGDYVAVGLKVYVERQIGQKSTNAQIFCNHDRSYNISKDCVGVIDKLQTQFEKETMERIGYFESNFKTSDQRSKKFQELLVDYRLFDGYVKGNMTELQRQTDECEIYVALLESKKYLVSKPRSTDILYD